MGNAGGGLYDDLEVDGLRASLGTFDGGHEGIDGIDVTGAAHFGDHDLVEPVARLFQQVHHVAIPIGRVEPVDPHRERLFPPVHIVDRLDHIGAGRVLVRGRHRIFEIEIDHIRVRGRHLGEELGIGAGAKELAAVRAGRGGGLNTEGHYRLASLLHISRDSG
jgi:hypothetical protein